MSGRPVSANDVAIKAKAVRYAATTLLPPLKTSFAVQSLFTYFLEAWKTGGEDVRLDELLNAAAERRNHAIDMLSDPESTSEGRISETKASVDAYISCLRHFVQAKAPDKLKRFYDPIEKGSKEEAHMIQSQVCRAVPFQWQDVLSDNPHLLFNDVESVWHMGFDGAAMLLSLGIWLLRAANNQLEAAQTATVDSHTALTAHNLLLQAAGVFVHVKTHWLPMIGPDLEHIPCRDCSKAAVDFFAYLACADGQGIAVMQAIHSQQPDYVARVAWDTALLYDSAAEALLKARSAGLGRRTGHDRKRQQASQAGARRGKEESHVEQKLKGWPLLAFNYIKYKSASLKAYAFAFQGEATFHFEQDRVQAAHWLQFAAAAQLAAAAEGSVFRKEAARSKLAGKDMGPMWYGFDKALTEQLKAIAAQVGTLEASESMALPEQQIEAKRVVKAKEYLIPEPDPNFLVAGASVLDLRPPDMWDDTRRSMLLTMSLEHVDSWSEYTGMTSRPRVRPLVGSPRPSPAIQPPDRIATAERADAAAVSSPAPSPAESGEAPATVLDRHLAKTETLLNVRKPPAQPPPPLRVEDEAKPEAGKGVTVHELILQDRRSSRAASQQESPPDKGAVRPAAAAAAAMGNGTAPARPRGGFCCFG